MGAAEPLRLLSGGAAAEQAQCVQLAAPVAGGVRDYWQCLRDQWQTAGLSSDVIELDQARAREAPLSARLVSALASGPCVLLLHYSGYGFHPRGLCGWLIDEIETALDAGRGRLRLMTMFHELYASGPPWGSAFWLQGRQAALAARLARASDAVLTNTQLHAHWLRRQVRPGTPVQVRPVFSTIGEPPGAKPSAQRRPRLVVFGSASTRARALQRLPAYATRLRRLGVEEVVEAGAGDSVPWACGALPLRRLGRLDAPALQALLDDTRWALIDYPSVHLGKSTVFAGYAVHGLAVLNTAPPGPDADGLLEGGHYHTLARGGRNWADAPQCMADAARLWYADHGLAQQALEVSALLARLTAGAK